MKSYHFLIASISLFLTVNSYAQDEKFTGIGIFKIGTDTTALYTYASDNKIKVSIMDDEMKYISAKYSDTKKSELYLLRHSKKNDMITISYCPDVSEYFLTTYNLASISIKHITLKYFKGKLIEFHCDQSKELEDAMKVKYGDPVLTTETDTSKCVYNLTGNTREILAKKFYSKWANEDITATSYIGEYFDSHCEKKYLSYFYYIVKNADYTSCDTEYRKKYMVEKYGPTVSKDKLKDF